MLEALVIREVIMVFVIGFWAGSVAGMGAVTWVWDRERAARAEVQG